MRHAKSKYALNRFTSWRKATLRSMARDLLIYQSIRTTRTKAKAVKPYAERLISLAKTNTLSARRQAFAFLGDHKLVTLLFNDIGQRFANITGGYTRIIGAGIRRGDNADMVIFELTQIKKKEKRKPKKQKEAQPQEAREIKEPQERIEAPPEQKTKTETVVKEKPPITQKPSKKFLGGLRNIFKKERDSL